MNREIVHTEGVKCVKKVQTYIDGLQTCPVDMQEEYAFQIVNGVVGEAFNFWWAKDREDSFADTLCDYEEVWRWVREDMVRQGCKFYPEAGAYTQVMHYLGKILVNHILVRPQVNGLVKIDDDKLTFEFVERRDTSD